ncbi:ead/Ea22-like family protein [Escherichia coli]|uniref:ead/Ea22-like family protein n=1 Tax=Escherichia coli TaxID=562 RepID=UPI000FDF6C0C|nr:ead/Ea22-like family protein [Escherichia coli]QAA02762.1 ead/Ea22-like family protein [Escherichia coli]
MSNIDKRALREAAEKATPGRWEYYLGNTSIEYNVDSMVEDQGSIVYVDSGDFTQKQTDLNGAFIAAANPATMLALLDELEAGKEMVELQRFKLERQAEDLHQAKSLERIHREKRFEVEREFSDYKHSAESNSTRLAKEVCRLEDELIAAGIRINRED